MSSSEAGVTPIVRLVADKIRASGTVGTDLSGRPCPCISFRDYMALCLYEPVHGYYRREGGGARVGREGDFYTSAYIGDAMGERLGAYLAELAADRFGGGREVRLVDWGGGTGRLASQLLEGWKTADEKAGRTRVVRLAVVDGSPEHRARAREMLAEEIRLGTASVLDEREAEAADWRSTPTLVVANELLDAMPVHRVVRSRDGLKEWGVAWSEREGAPYSCLLEPTTPRLAEALAASGIRLRIGQTTEINLGAEEWLAERAGQLGPSVLAVIDYGDESSELTAEHRMEGTLMSYRRHVASADPYSAPGQQDLTAHVDFTAVRRAAGEAGWTALWYGTQQRFLVEAGLLERLAEHNSPDPFHPDARRNRAIRQLLLSDGMSELFKVLLLAKH